MLLLFFYTSKSNLCLLLTTSAVFRHLLPISHFFKLFPNPIFTMNSTITCLHPPLSNLPFYYSFKTISNSIPSKSILNQLFQKPNFEITHRQKPQNFKFQICFSNSNPQIFYRLHQIYLNRNLKFDYTMQNLQMV